jgi:flagellar biosynthesis anti-sigma factor FlgM
MKTGATGTIGAHLYLVGSEWKEHSRRRKKNVERALSWQSERDSARRPSLIQQGMAASQRWPVDRTARVEALRAQVQNGTYTVDRMAVAERMLKNETHFMEDECNR